jgi:EAL domain-containing protein (putative c-di-GMP-specific phosphodiesterase class I)
MDGDGSDKLRAMIGPGAADAGPEDGVLKRALQAVRSHLGMQVAYISEFHGDEAVIVETDASDPSSPIKAGDVVSLERVYCRHVLEGRLPALIQDTAANAFASAMPVTAAAGIRSHMSVPVHLPDGTVHGMFCCIGHEPDPSLNTRDLQMMKAFADLAGYEIAQDLERGKSAREKTDRIRSALAEGGHSIAYQPIWDIATRRPVGFECLARFSASPERSPDRWFHEAGEVGLGIPLELAAIRAALSALPDLTGNAYLAVNASPATALSSDLYALLDGVPGKRLVLEITEHAHVEDYGRLGAALAPLRARGIRLAVDDAGAGYASLQHILHLQPDIIKLDMTLTRNVDGDPARRALAAALIDFARNTGIRIVAEGVETEAELATLRQLGAHYAQGYLLGRPMPLAEARRIAFAAPTASAA